MKLHDNYDAEEAVVNKKATDADSHAATKEEVSYVTADDTMRSIDDDIAVIEVIDIVTKLQVGYLIAVVQIPDTGREEGE